MCWWTSKTFFRYYMIFHIITSTDIGPCLVQLFITIFFTYE